MTGRQNPSSPDGSSQSSSAATSEPSVRGAVGPRSVEADPGPTSTSATPQPAKAARGEGEATARPRPDTSAGGAASAPSGTTGGSTEEEKEAGAAASRQRSSQPEAESASARPQAASAGAVAAPVARAAAVAGVPLVGGTARGKGELSSGNPKKPLLAAAGIAGVVLLAVPLLIWATNDSEREKDTVSVSAESDTVLGGASADAPRGDYVPARPTPPSTSAKPSAKAKPKAKKPSSVPERPSSVPVPPPAPPQKKSPSGTGQTKQQAPKPTPNTAALAVQRLAAASPGRHICYRAYVTGIGWQAPVCDGATAGTEGQNRPIKALNVAVSGTKGTSANEFIQEAGWTTAWTGAVDGVDLSIGSARKDAPNMSGFAIAVNDGVVCQNAWVRDGGWLGMGCDTPGKYIFGGSLDKDRWLEAVRFTV